MLPTNGKPNLLQISKSYFSFIIKHLKKYFTYINHVLLLRLFSLLLSSNIKKKIIQNDVLNGYVNLLSGLFKCCSGWLMTPPSDMSWGSKDLYPNNGNLVMKKYKHSPFCNYCFFISKQSDNHPLSSFSTSSLFSQFSSAGAVPSPQCLRPWQQGHWWTGCW